VSDVDEAIARIARRQGWNVSYEQLMEVGMTRMALRHRLARGLLVEEFFHVYSVGRPPTNPIDRAHAALLATGPRSALSHTSAGSLWRITKRWREPLHVSTPLDRRPRGIVTHHRPSLTRADIHTDEETGLRVTTAALSVLDNARSLGEKRLIRAVNELRLGGHLEVEELQEMVERFPRHPGRRLVERVIGQAQSQPTRSGLEDRWPPFADEHGFTGWTMNALVCGYRVDVLFEPDLLIVELDGPVTHDMPLQAQADKHQDADIYARMGIPTIRITEERFASAPAEHSARIRQILAARRGPDG
jgi:hypothetical protein